jgi:hypothetical protein
MPTIIWNAFGYIHTRLPPYPTLNEKAGSDFIKPFWTNITDKTVVFWSNLGLQLWPYMALKYLEIQDFRPWYSNKYTFLVLGYKLVQNLRRKICPKTFCPKCSFEKSILGSPGHRELAIRTCTTSCWRRREPVCKSLLSIGVFKTSTAM